MKIGLSFLLFCCCMSSINAQVAQKIGDNPFTLDKSAVFEMQSTTKGLLPPRMTTAQRDAIVKPAKGLIIYNSSTNVIEVNSGTLDTPVWLSSVVSPVRITDPAKTADYTILESDSTVLFDTTSANLKATLPTASANNKGKIYHIRKNDNTSKTLTIVPDVLVTGVSTSIILNYARTIKVQSSGSAWVVID
jgi:hypothetical protein